MSVYLDLAAFGTDEELSRIRIEALGLTGFLLPQARRRSLLHFAQPGDSVVTLPSSYPYWRLLARSVSVVSAQGGEDNPNRRLSPVAWRLVQLGVSDQEARRLEKQPPKSQLHLHYDVFLKALLEGEEPPPIGQLEFIGKGRGPQEEPFTWHLYGEEDEHVVRQLMEQGGVIGIDCETDVTGDTPNENRDRLVGVGLAFENNHSYYSGMGNDSWRALLMSYLPTLSAVGWNYKYDYVVMRRHGLNPAAPVGDGMLAAYLLGEPNAGLKDTVLRKYGVMMISYLDVVGGKGVPISTVDPLRVAHYCCADAYWGRRATLDLEEELRKQPQAWKLYEETDIPLIETLAKMQEEGVGFNREEAGRELERVIGEAGALERVIQEEAEKEGFANPAVRRICNDCHNGKKKKLTCSKCEGLGESFTPVPMNVGSNLQRAELLFGVIKLPMQQLSKKTGRPGVDALTLLRLQDRHPVVRLLREWSILDKYRSFLVSWLAGSEEDGRLHTVLTNAFVRSGRLSSREPNLQQVSLEWRGLFTP